MDHYSEAEASFISASKDEPVAVSLRLQARDARLFRALTELEGDEVAASVVSAAVRERMKIVARRLIDEGPAHA